MTVKVNLFLGKNFKIEHLKNKEGKIFELSAYNQFSSYLLIIKNKVVVNPLAVEKKRDQRAARKYHFHILNKGSSNIQEFILNSGEFIFDRNEGNGK